MRRAQLYGIGGAAGRVPRCAQIYSSASRERRAQLYSTSCGSSRLFSTGGGARQGSNGGGSCGGASSSSSTEYGAPARCRAQAIQHRRRLSASHDCIAQPATAAAGRSMEQYVAAGQHGEARHWIAWRGAVWRRRTLVFFGNFRSEIQTWESTSFGAKLG